MANSAVCGAPCARQPASAITPRGARQDGKRYRREPNSPLQGVKVMVIDDSNTIRRSAEIFLLQAGCTVILAEDGFDALAKIADHQPDLVFVDIMMPRLDGYQTCALIKKNAHFHSTPVVMLSSKDGLFDRARGRMVGSDQYLTKPFTKESLLKAVAAHVKRVRRHERSRSRARPYAARAQARRPTKGRHAHEPSRRFSSSTIRRPSGMS